MDQLLGAIFAAILEPLLTVVGAFLEAVFAALLSAVVHFLLSCLLYLVAVPFSCALFTPVVLIRALFGAGHYSDKVMAGYRGICAGLVHAGCWV